MAVLAVDIAARWRPLTDAEGVAALAFVGAATRLIRATLPTLQQRVDAGLVDPELVDDIIISMVLRVLKNPDGIRQESESIDDFTHSWTVDSAQSTGGLYLTLDERSLLLPRQTSRLFGSIRVGVPEILRTPTQRRYVAGEELDDGQNERGPLWR